MMKQIQEDIRNNFANKVLSLNLALDLGKSFTKSCSETLDENGNSKLYFEKFPSIIADAEKKSYNAASTFSTSLFPNRYYYVDNSALCDTKPSSDNEKNGTGTSGDSNRDAEIVSVCACYAICRAINHHNVTIANLAIALGSPLSEFSKGNKNKHRIYFESILPLNKEIICFYEGVKYIFTIIRHQVCPETLSAFIAESGKNMGNIVLVDIGGNNIQYLRYANGKIDMDKGKTYTAKGGINSLIRRIIILMEQEQIEPSASYAEVLEYLSGTSNLSYNNDWKNRFTKLTNEEKKVFFKLLMQAFDPIHGNYRDDILRGYKICFTGGGSVLFRSEIRNYKNAISLPDGEYANVKGFYQQLIKHF